MKQIFQRAARLMLWDFSTLLLFELCYRLLALSIAYPVLQWLLRYSMRQAGLQYLTNQNVRLLLQSPLAILLLLLLLLIAAFYIFVEMTAIVLYCEAGRKGERLGVVALFWSAVKKAMRILRPGNLSLLLFVLLLLPLVGFTLTPGLLRSVRVPEFILDFLHQAPVLYGLYLAILVGLAFLVFRWIFSIHEVTLEQKRFRLARKESARLLRGRWMKTFGYFILWLFLLTLAGALLYGCVVLVLLGAFRLFFSGAQGERLFWESYQILDSWASFFLPILEFVGSFALLSTLYRQYRGQQDVPISLLPHKNKRRLFSVIARILLLVLLTDSVTQMAGPQLPMMEQIELFHTTTITAHRAGASDAPENTMAALYRAVENGADYAEVDVRTTQDGRLVLLHDESLRRVTGINKRIGSMTYEELKKMDVGSWFSPDYRGEQVPTLEQALAFAKGRIKLVVELKDEAAPERMVQSVVSLIQKYGMVDQCVVVSMEPELVRLAKRLEPSLTAGMLTTLVYGELYRLEGFDLYAVEATFVTRQMVETLHQNGKQIFVWTVNNQETMKRLAAMRVDSIITDAPALARQVLKSAEKKPWIERMVKLTFYGKASAEERSD